MEQIQVSPLIYSKPCSQTFWVTQDQTFTSLLNNAVTYFAGQDELEPTIRVDDEKQFVLCDADGNVWPANGNVTSHLAARPSRRLRSVFLCSCDPQIRRTQVVNFAVRPALSAKLCSEIRGPITQDIFKTVENGATSRMLYTNRSPRQISATNSNLWDDCNAASESGFSASGGINVEYALWRLFNYYALGDGWVFVNGISITQFIQLYRDAGLLLPPVPAEGSWKIDEANQVRKRSASVPNDVSIQASCCTYPTAGALATTKKQLLCLIAKQITKGTRYLSYDEFLNVVVESVTTLRGSPMKHQTNNSAESSSTLSTVELLEDLQLVLRRHLLPLVHKLVLESPYIDTWKNNFTTLTEQRREIIQTLKGFVSPLHKVFQSYSVRRDWAIPPETRNYDTLVQTTNKHRKHDQKARHRRTFVDQVVTFKHFQMFLRDFGFDTFGLSVRHVGEEFVHCASRVKSKSDVISELCKESLNTQQSSSQLYLQQQAQQSCSTRSTHGHGHVHETSRLSRLRKVHSILTFPQFLECIVRLSLLLSGDGKKNSGKKGNKRESNTLENKKSVQAIDCVSRIKTVLQHLQCMFGDSISMNKSVYHLERQRVEGKVPICGTTQLLRDAAVQFRRQYFAMWKQDGCPKDYHKIREGSMKQHQVVLPNIDTENIETTDVEVEEQQQTSYGTTRKPLSRMYLDSTVNTIPQCNSGLSEGKGIVVKPEQESVSKTGVRNEKLLDRYSDEANNSINNNQGTLKSLATTNNNSATLIQIGKIHQLCNEGDAQFTQAGLAAVATTRSCTTLPETSKTINYFSETQQYARAQNVSGAVQAGNLRFKQALEYLESCQNSRLLQLEVQCRWASTQSIFCQTTLKSILGHNAPQSAASIWLLPLAPALYDIHSATQVFKLTSLARAVMDTSCSLLSTSSTRIAQLQQLGNELQIKLDHVGEICTHFGVLEQTDLLTDQEYSNVEIHLKNLSRVVNWELATSKQVLARIKIVEMQFRARIMPSIPNQFPYLKVQGIPQQREIQELCFTKSFESLQHARKLLSQAATMKKFQLAELQARESRFENINRCNSRTKLGILRTLSVLCFEQSLCTTVCCVLLILRSKASWVTSEHKPLHHRFRQEASEALVSARKFSMEALQVANQFVTLDASNNSIPTNEELKMFCERLLSTCWVWQRVLSAERYILGLLSVIMNGGVEKDKFAGTSQRPKHERPKHGPKELMQNRSTITPSNYAHVDAHRTSCYSNPNSDKSKSTKSFHPNLIAQNLHELLGIDLRNLLSSFAKTAWTEAFKRFDTDGDGSLSKRELDMFNQTCSEQECCPQLLAWLRKMEWVSLNPMLRTVLSPNKAAPTHQRSISEKEVGKALSSAITDTSLVSLSYNGFLSYMTWVAIVDPFKVDQMVRLLGTTSSFKQPPVGSPTALSEIDELEVSLSFSPKKSSLKGNEDATRIQRAFSEAADGIQLACSPVRKDQQDKKQARNINAVAHVRSYPKYATLAPDPVITDVQSSQTTKARHLTRGSAARDLSSSPHNDKKLPSRLPDLCSTDSNKEALFENTIPESRIVDFFLVVSPCKLVDMSQLHHNVAIEELEFTPEVTFSWPDASSNTVVQQLGNIQGDCPLPAEIPMFCFPQGAQLELAPRGNPPPPHRSGFVLTDSAGNHRYGACLTFYESGTSLQALSDRIRANTNLARSTDNSAEKLHDEKDFNDIFQWFLSITSANCYESTPKHGKGGIDELQLFTPTCICVVSRWPFHRTFSGFLDQVYRITTAANPSPISLERFIVNFVHETPVPPRGRTQVQVAIADRCFYLARPALNQLPLTDLSFQSLFESLEVEQVVLVLTCLLQEKKVALCSRDTDKLFLCCETLLSLLFPFRWHSIYIPVLPKVLLEFLFAPVTFLMGVHAGYLDQFAESTTPSSVRSDGNETRSGFRSLEPNDVVFVDLDRGNVHMPFGYDDPDDQMFVEMLPETLRKKLISAMESVLVKHPEWQQDSTIITKNQTCSLNVEGNNSKLTSSLQSSNNRASNPPRRFTRSSLDCENVGMGERPSQLATSSVVDFEAFATQAKREQDSASGRESFVTTSQPRTANDNSGFSINSQVPSIESSNDDNMKLSLDLDWQLKIREACLQMFVSLLGNYRKHLVQRNTQHSPNSPSFNNGKLRPTSLRTGNEVREELGSGSWLDKHAFVHENASYRRFLRELVETQMFEVFVDERVSLRDFIPQETASASEATVASFAAIQLFDEYIIRKQSKRTVHNIRRGRMKKSTPMLSDTRGRIIHTHFVQPPTMSTVRPREIASSNAATETPNRTRLLWKYPGFPRLQDALFQPITFKKHLLAVKRIRNKPKEEQVVVAEQNRTEIEGKTDAVEPVPMKLDNGFESKHRGVGSFVCASLVNDMVSNAEVIALQRKAERLERKNKRFQDLFEVMKRTRRNSLQHVMNNSVAAAAAVASLPEASTP